jgi:hypothetical protein
MKPLKKIWIIIGIVVFAWTAFWFVNVRILNHYEFIINVVFLIIGYCLLINYILITLVFLMIKRLKKKWKIKKSSSQGKLHKK